MSKWKEKIDVKRIVVLICYVIPILLVPLAATGVININLWVIFVLLVPIGLVMAAFFWKGLFTYVEETKFRFPRFKAKK